MKIKILGLDITKDIFELHGIDGKSKIVIKSQIKRDDLSEIVAQLPACLIGIVACLGAHYWGRKFTKMGHNVRLINPLYFKYLTQSSHCATTNAEVICEALKKSDTKLIRIKSIEQQDILAIHRVRGRLIKERNTIVNQINNFLLEYGIIISRNTIELRKKIYLIVEDEKNELTPLGRELFRDLQEQLYTIDEKISEYDKKVKWINRIEQI